MTEAAPLVYYNLTGTFGLATQDPAWEALMQPGASAGLGFVTNGVVHGDSSRRPLLSRRQGLLRLREQGGKAKFSSCRTRTWCASGARHADADGYHSLVRTGGSDSTMPPLATVTLEKVEEPGEWECVRPQGAAAAVHGARDVQRRT